MREESRREQKGQTIRWGHWMSKGKVKIIERAQGNQAGTDIHDVA